MTKADRRIVKLEEQHSLLQQEFVGLDGHAKKLVRDKELLTEENKDLRAALHTIEDKISRVHGQLRTLIQENNTLREEQTVVKKLAIKEYEESPALTDKIMTRFAEGFEAYREKARAKLIDAGLDASILDSSDEEYEPEAGDSSP